MFPRAIFVPVVMAITSLAIAAPATPAVPQIEQYLQAEMQRLHIPGLAVSIISDGKVLYAKGLGYSNLEHQTPVQVDTVFQSASTGKQYTAMAILQLVQAGKLKLDDPVRKTLTDAPASWNAITIRHLLNHTAGLAANLSKLDLRQEMTDAQMRSRIYQEKLQAPAGAAFSYSNLGYVILGAVIEQASGQSYGEYLQQHIFGPLGMQQSRVVDESSLIPGRASPYEWDGKGWKNVSWSAPVYNRGGDGALLLSLPDVARWDQALNGETLVKRELLQQAFTSGKLSDGSSTGYGFGWLVRNINEQPVVEHSGVWQGYSAQISRYVNARLTVAMFANLDSAPLDRLTHQVAGLWDARLQPPAPAVMADTEPAVTAMLKERVGQLASGALPPGAFSPEAAAEFFPDQAREYQAMLAPMGALRTISLSKRREDKGVRVYIYRLTLGETNMLCQLRLNQQEQIVMLAFRPE